MANELSPKDKILAALAQLDPNNDSHWNTDGLPNTGTVQRIASDQTIKRGDLQNARPGFDRDAARAEATAARAEADAPAAPGSGGGGLSQTVKAEAVAAVAENEEVEISDDQLRGLLGKRVKDAEQKLEQGRQMARDAAVMQQDGLTEINAARREFHKYFPPMTQAQNIKAHLAAENAARAARVSQQGTASHLDAVRRAPVSSVNRGYGPGASRGAFSRKEANRLGVNLDPARGAVAAPAGSVKA